MRREVILDQHSDLQVHDLRLEANQLLEAHLRAQQARADFHLELEALAQALHEAIHDQVLDQADQHLEASRALLPADHSVHDQVLVADDHDFQVDEEVDEEMKDQIFISQNLLIKQ